MTYRLASFTRIALALAVMAAATMFLAPRPALASIRISPPKFDYVVYPGDVIQDVVSLVNEGTQDVELVPAVLNFTAQEDDETSGSPESYPADEIRTGTEMASWVEIDLGTVIVPANGRANFPFTIRVPENASPGGHFGLIELTLQAPGQEPGVGVTAASGSLIFVRVEGDTTEKLVVDRFMADSTSYSHLPVNFEMRLVNEGNTHLRPVGHIFIKDMFGRQVAAPSVNSNFQTILPDSARRFEATWTKGRVSETASELKKQLSNFAFGKHTATLSLNYGTEGQTVMMTRDFVVLPWLALAVWAGGLLILFIVLFFGFKAYNKALIRSYEKRQMNNKK